jgi:hypothetical protein
MNSLSHEMALQRNTMTRIIDNMVGKGCIEGVKNRRDGGVMNVPLIRRGREMPKEWGGALHSNMLKAFLDINLRKRLQSGGVPEMDYRVRGEGSSGGGNDMKRVKNEGETR